VAPGARGPRLPAGTWTAILCAGFVLVCAAAALVLDTTKSDLDGFFWPSAEIAAHGHPLLVYSVRQGQYPDANGPLSLVPLTLVAALANALGVATNMPVRDALAEGLFAGFTLLMAREAVLAVEAGRGRPVRRLLTGAVFLALPPLWVATIGFGHVEQPLELWLVLLGVRLLGAGATLRAGLCLGLAALTRSLAVVSLIPLLPALVAERRLRSLAVLLGTAALVAVIGLLPFWLADRSDLVYSLVSYRASLPVAGGTFWVAFQGAPWIGVVRSGDSWIFAGAALGLGALMLGLRRGGGTAPPRVFGLMAVAALCVPVLAKTSWPYYLLDPCVFATIWWLGQPSGVRSWRAIPPLAVAAGGAVLGGVEQSLPLGTVPGEVAGFAGSAGAAAVIALIVAGDLRSAGSRRPLRRGPPGWGSPGWWTRRRRADRMW